MNDETCSDLLSSGSLLVFLDLLGISGLGTGIPPVLSDDVCQSMQLRTMERKKISETRAVVFVCYWFDRKSTDSLLFLYMISYFSRHLAK